MSDGPATRADLFDAMDRLAEEIKDVYPPSSPSPFAGRKLFVWNSHSTSVKIDGPVKCLDHVGSHLYVEDPGGKAAWINLNVIPSVEFLTDDEYARASQDARYVKVANAAS